MPWLAPVITTFLNIFFYRRLGFGVRHKSQIERRFALLVLRSVRPTKDRKVDRLAMQSERFRRAGRAVPEPSVMNGEISHIDLYGDLARIGIMSDDVELARKELPDALIVRPRNQAESPEFFR